MRQIKILIISFCALFISAGSLHGNPLVSDQFTGDQLSVSVEKRSAVEVTYTSQIGVRELTGRNDGKEVEMYLASCNRKKGDAWCAAFVNWSLQENNIITPKSGWSPSWFPKSKTFYLRGVRSNYPPRPGDVMGIYYSQLKRIGHVGFVHRWQDGNIAITVEGNTNGAGSREGNGVYYKRRLKTQIYAVSNWIG